MHKVRTPNKACEFYVVLVFSSLSFVHAFGILPNHDCMCLNCVKNTLHSFVFIFDRLFKLSRMLFSKQNHCKSNGILKISL